VDGLGSYKVVPEMHMQLQLLPCSARCTVEVLIMHNVMMHKSVNA
jgi:hypothetical protein